MRYRTLTLCYEIVNNEEEQLINYMFAAKFIITNRMNRKYFIILLASLFITPYFNKCAAQDTLKVVAYNTLDYGNSCQGSHTFLQTNFKKIVQYIDPDILGMVKVQSIQRTSADGCGLSNLGFADSILTFVFNAAYPGQYNYCPYTNAACANNIDLLFYNVHKLGYVSLNILTSNGEDFDLYKLYYLDPNLSTTHDSTFLYVVLNHTNSSTLATRNQQDSDVVNSLKKIFYHLPNLISMGDFNVATSTEAGYELYTSTTDTSFLFDDPPFLPDGKFTYPLNWDKNSACSAYLNTSTRSSSTVPNSCGASGGAKDWIEHIFLSKWIIDSIDYVSYIKDSYTTIGNDGKHFELSINDSTGGPKNTYAPSSVINALYAFSDKYPIMVKLKVNPNTTGTGPVNPVNGVNEVAALTEKVTINNPMHNIITLHYPNAFMGKKVCITLYDVCGRELMNATSSVNSNMQQLPVNLVKGVYMLHIVIDGCATTIKLINQ